MRWTRAGSCGWRWRKRTSSVTSPDLRGGSWGVGMPLVLSFRRRQAYGGQVRSFGIGIKARNRARDDGLTDLFSQEVTEVTKAATDSLRYLP